LFTPTKVLLVRTDRRTCALALEHVVEIMRPLPAEPVRGMPPFLRGIAILRGVPVPVVDLGSLLGMTDTSEPRRFVLLRMASRLGAIAVGAVLGVRELDAGLVHRLPPLLQDVDSQVVTAVSVHDEHLLLVLEAMRLIPEEVWEELEKGQLVS
jgi:purine-binding chemotaxis protein CheW